MKRIALIMAVLVIGACSKGTKASPPESDTTHSRMMMGDSTHTGMDTTKPK